MNNICLLSDSYKFGHDRMYCDGTTKVYSYFEARKGAKYNKTVFFGLQYLLKKYLEGKVIDKDKINEACDLIGWHLGRGSFNKEGWEYILKKHDGRLPVTIKSVLEGTPVDINNVMMTIENTDPKCYWLTNYLETLLTHVWYPSTVSTLSREIKIMLNQYLEWTSENKEILPFQLHDFGFRGVSSVESAGMGGAGHLVNFKGTDTVAAIKLAMDYYNSGVCGYSVPATEHSIMTSLGKDGEMDVVENLLKKYDKGILSIVIDSYDYADFIKKITEKYKEEIIKRDGKIVFRPDSGDPVSVSSEVMELLGEYFGFEKNKLGYKVLNPKVGMLWGDGIDYQGIRNILFQMKLDKWSSENIVFGCGGGLLQKINRDTQRFAFKCSAQERNGSWYDIYKKPKDVSKVSKKGKLKLVIGEDGYETVSEKEEGDDQLELIFENGEVLVEQNFADIRKRSI